MKINSLSASCTDAIRSWRVRVGQNGAKNCGGEYNGGRRGRVTVRGGPSPPG